MSKKPVKNGPSQSTGIVGAYEAKNGLGSLLDRVEQGESFVITRHGKPVARLMPYQDLDYRAKAEAAFAVFDRIAKGKRISPEEIKSLIQEGRKR